MSELYATVDNEAKEHEYLEIAKKQDDYEDLLKRVAERQADFEKMKCNFLGENHHQNETIEAQTHDVTGNTPYQEDH